MYKTFFSLEVINKTDWSRFDNILKPATFTESVMVRLNTLYVSNKKQ